MSSEPPTTEATAPLERYELQRELGRGGAAEVWLAWDRELERHVALKILSRAAHRDPSQLARFRHEAVAAGMISHPGVVDIYERGELSDGRSYIAMRYVDGETLTQRIRRGVTVSEAVRITREILAALAAAHARGVTHRDMKPGNVLISKDGRVFVSDFGIATSESSEPLTKPGVVVGSVSFFSPEQALGERVDSRSDLFSVGVILYQMLTSKNPFTRPNSVETATQIAKLDPPLPSQLNPRVPRELDAVLLKALAKSPEERFQTAEEFSAALSGGPVAAEATAAQTAVVRETPPHRRLWIAVLLLLAALAAGAGIWWLLTQESLVEVPRVTRESAADAQNELTEAGLRSELTRHTSHAPPGQVIRQTPRAGVEVSEGSTVTLVVSTGVAKLTIPDVSGSTTDKATEKLESAGLRVSSDQPQREFSEDVAAGRVIRTDPEAGVRVEPKSEISLIVSKGVAPIPAPDLVGVSQEQAEAQLERLGLGVEVQKERADAPIGQVTAQSPEAGSELNAGETVELTIASGPPLVTLEDYRGSTREEAQQGLSEAGFQTTITEVETSDPSEDGIVIRQKPLAGRELEPGSLIELFVGRYLEE